MSNKPPVRVFVGTSPGTDDLDAELALEYSLKANCSREIEIVFMRNNNDPNNFFGRFNQPNCMTPFTNLRWAIPEYCGYKGRALYMDVDIVNFRDIAELFDMDMRGKPLATRKGDNKGNTYPRCCIMLMDCEKCPETGLFLPVEELRNFTSKPYIDEVLIKFEKRNLITFYDKRWNVLDDEGMPISQIWNLHFTEMLSQPWKPAWGPVYYKRKGFKWSERSHPRPDLVMEWTRIVAEAKKSRGLDPEMDRWNRMLKGQNSS